MDREELKINKRVIQLYAVPADLIPAGGECGKSSASIPVGMLPQVIYRNDNDLSGKLAELFTWFEANLEEVDGYIPASAALPALSLNNSLWAEAVGLLEAAIAKYERVSGPVFVPMGVTRTSHFNVADWYGKMLQGSTMVAVVNYRQAVVEEPVVEDKPEVIVNYVAEEPIVQEPAE